MLFLLTLPLSETTAKLHKIIHTATKKVALDTETHFPKSEF